ncbi:MAG: AAA family ATPase [Bacteroidia bacterium]|nr:AAA family ATPase [Bacteroidia bacterium]MDW8089021.1 shikimate kinase [Bacteroidia bacterium]
MKRRVFLVGPPAAGKTTLGKRWAKELGVPFYDTDEEVERRTGLTPAAWLLRGEEAFRAVERSVVEALLAEGAWGLWATGGGTLTQAKLAERLWREGYIVWIDPPSEWLYERLEQGAAGRPLLAQQPPEKWLAFLEARRPFYRQAHLHWNPARIPEERLLYWLRRLFARL